MYKSLFMQIIAALNLLHVKGISIYDTPLPMERKLLGNKSGGHVTKNLLSTNQISKVKPARLESLERGQNIFDPIRVKQNEGSIFTLDCLENMMRAHAQLHSKSESEVQQALRVIRSQLFNQIGADRKWRSGGSIAIMNLKALEVVLLKIDAKDRVDGSLTELERYVLRNAMQIIYDLRSFSDLRAERVWFSRQIKQFFVNSNSVFLRDEYSQAVRRAQIGQAPLDIAQYDQIRGIVRIPGGPHMPPSLSGFLTAPSRIEESQVFKKNTPQDIIDFVRLFNAQQAETNVSDFEPIIERLAHALENPPSRNLDPQANSLRVELIALAARTFALKNTQSHDEEWVFPFFTHLMRLTKLASGPEDRIQAEELVQFLQLVKPSIHRQFIQEYPIVLKDIIEKDFKCNGIKTVFDRVLSNGPEKELRKTALELQTIFERIQNFHFHGNLVASRVENPRLEKIPGHPLALLKNAQFPQFLQALGGKWARETQTINRFQPSLELAIIGTADLLVEREAENWTRLTSDLKHKFLLSSSASTSSRMMAEEVLFAGGLLAFKKFRTLPIQKRGFESLYKTSINTLKNLENDIISQSAQSARNTILCSLSNKFSYLIANKSD
ncbi:hypothetical protein PGT21_010257 [Puccinia graminis f. sp. tritici]|uniref:Uncharacterized protein n=1 Tax=Puccinia graminis f. sp. tritici TaxID=56615 RepID=A0A5B0P7L1_PUCGR|nr:hypothetical protein PGT21_010257 [Puccinia graminis f. sp. tritici]KAA1099121.1 hypothetical protein PGTUg99_023176 [Puccinia graminis f. sp. tritici]